MHTIDHNNGFRASAESAFLRIYLGRPNFPVFNNTLGERIIFDDSTIATSAKVTTANTTYILHIKGEVALASGTFQSPQLLQVLNVGPAALLQEHGIPVVADRPIVGDGMNNQVLFGIVYRVNLQTVSSLLYGDISEIALNEFTTNATGPLTSLWGLRWL